MPIDSVATVALIAWMLWAGYVGPVGRPFSWPMYSYGEIVEVSLFDDSGSPVSIFDVRSPGEFAIPPDELSIIVDFLRDRGTNVHGGGVVLGPYGQRKLRVEAGNVVVGEFAE